MEEVIPEKGFTTSEVDLEDTQPVKFVNEPGTLIKAHLPLKLFPDIGRKTMGT
jgi:hypothetical protein